MNVRLIIFIPTLHSWRHSFNTAKCSTSLAAAAPRHCRTLWGGHFSSVVVHPNRYQPYANKISFSINSTYGFNFSEKLHLFRGFGIVTLNYLCTALSRWGEFLTRERQSLGYRNRFYLECIPKQHLNRIVVIYPQLIEYSQGGKVHGIECIYNGSYAGINI